MSGVPYTFGNATTSIPLSQLDVNFATNATLGNASVGLGNTTTTVGNLTVSNISIVSTNGDANVHGLTVGLGGGSVSTNTVFGTSALQANTSGANNTAIGYQAGYTNSTGTGNVFLGQNAGYTSNASSSNGYNTCVGFAAGYALTTGIQNTFIGTPGVSNGAGGVITTGSKNTIIGGYNGNYGGLDIRTSSNYIVLSDGDGNPKYYTNGTTHTLATSASSEGTAILALGGNWGTMYWSGYGQDSANSANASFKLGKTTNGRSINAGGTFNASGADYAEYMTKANNFTINKGDICGIDVNGKLTNVFANL